MKSGATPRTIWTPHYSARSVGENAALSVFDLHNPEVRVEPRFLFQKLIDVRFADLAAKRLAPDRRAVFISRFDIKPRAPIAEINLDCNGAGVNIAAPRDRGEGAGGAGATQLGGDANFSLEARLAHSGTVRYLPAFRNRNGL